MRYFARRSHEIRRECRGVGCKPKSLSVKSALFWGWRCQLSCLWRLAKDMEMSVKLNISIAQHPSGFNFAESLPF